MISVSQVAVPSGSAVSLGVLQGGYQAALTAFGGTIYIGNNGTITTATGAPLSGFCPLPPIPVTSQPSPLYAIGGLGGGTVAVGLILSGPR